MILTGGWIILILNDKHNLWDGLDLSRTIRAANYFGLECIENYRRLPK